MSMVRDIFYLRFNFHLLNQMIVFAYVQHDNIPREVKEANSESTDQRVGLPHKTLSHSIVTVQPTQIVCSLQS